MGITLTNDQQMVSDAFVQFMLSDDREFTISGPAGVGKTALLRHMMDSADYLKAADLVGINVPDYTWMLTATTNKAAEVLAEATNLETCTIHSALGLRITNDYSSGATSLKKHADAPVLERKILVIDEASMIDRQLYRLIQEGTYRCKIIFVGDHCQLAPIGENLSQVFQSQNQAPALTEIVRSKGTPELTALAMTMRNAVETGVLRDLQHVPGTIDFLNEEQVEQELLTNFVHNRTDSRILCYTNGSVNGFNRWIRDRQGMPQHFMRGEHVVAANAAHLTRQGSLKKSRLHIEKSYELLSDPEEGVFAINITGVDFEIPSLAYETYDGTVHVPKDPDLLAGALKFAKKHKNWFSYYTLNEYFADLRPEHAATVYKAQGSTYETVYVHLGDIGSCPNIRQALRMLYVACSRPTTRICFIGRLPDRFRSIFQE